MGSMRRQFEYLLKRLNTQELPSLRAEMEGQLINFDARQSSDLTTHIADRTDVHGVTVASGKLATFNKTVTFDGNDSLTHTLNTALTVTGSAIILSGAASAFSITGGTGTARTLTVTGGSPTLNGAGSIIWGSAVALTINQALTLTGTSGKVLTLTGSLTVGADTSITGGGTLALGGFTLTVPATGTAALLATANVFTAAQTIQTNTAPQMLVSTSSAAATNLFLNLRAHGTIGGSGANAELRFLQNDGTSDLIVGRLLASFANAIGARYVGFSAQKDKDGERFPLRFFTFSAADVATTGLFIGADTDVTKVSVGNSTTPLGQFTVRVNDPTFDGIVVRGASLQSGNLLELQNSSATVLANIDASGHMGLGETASSSTVVLNIAKAFDDFAGSRRGILSAPTITVTANTANLGAGLQASLSVDQAGFNATATVGVAGCRFQAIATGSSGTITGLVGVTGQVVNNGAGTVANGYGIFLLSASNSGGGTLTNNYGLYIQSQTVGASNFAVFTNSGIVHFGDSVGIGTSTPQSLLDASDAAGGILTLSRNDTNVASADRIGMIQFWNNDSSLTTQNIYAYIEAQAAQNITTDAAAGNLLFATTGTTAGGSPAVGLTLTHDRRLYGSALHNNAGSVTGTTNQYIASGTYTPTLTNTTNVAASTAYQCQWIRVGNVVTVTGKVDVDPTAAASTVLGISLPIASNIGAAEDCSGCAFASGIAGQGAAILGSAANDRALMQWVAVDVTNQAMYFTFSYEVI